MKNKILLQERKMVHYHHMHLSSGTIRLLNTFYKFIYNNFGLSESEKNLLFDIYRERVHCNGHLYIIFYPFIHPFLI